MSDIQTLALRVQYLTQSVDRWNTYMICALVAAAIVAILLVITTRVVISKSRQLADAQDILLKMDSKEKDLKIGETKAQTFRVETEAKERIARVEGEAARKIEEARLRADEANAEAKKATLAQEELKKQNLMTAEELEKERNTRLELEQSLAPRVIAFKTGGGKSNIDPLKPFAGIQMYVDVIPDDAEAQRAAGNIIWLAQEAGWKLSNARIDLEARQFDGVMVVAHKFKRSPENQFGTEEEQAAEKYSQKATEALVDFLKSNNWSADSLLHSSSGQNPPNSVKIIVGFKPSPYFLPKELKEMREHFKKIEEEVKSKTKQRVKEIEDFMLQLPKKE